MLSRVLTFSPELDESFFQELPAAAAVFLLRGEGEPYISKTANLRRRLQRLLGPRNENSKRLNLRDLIRQIEFTVTGSDFESQFLLYRLLRQTFPKTYRPSSTLPLARGSTPVPPKTSSRIFTTARSPPALPPRNLPATPSTSSKCGAALKTCILILHSPAARIRK